MQYPLFRRAALFGIVCALLQFAQIAQAATYRLVAGDRISVLYMGQGEPENVIVDVDGQVRLPGIGGIDVSGLTLDGAEETIGTAVNAAGLYVDPLVSVTMQEYAPIVVSGDVAQPGRFEFVPGTTIASALALSGGGQPTGISRFEVERARIEADGQLRTLNLEIAATVAQVARLEATFRKDETLELTPQDKILIPAIDAVPLQELIAAENAILQAELVRTAEALAYWDEEIRVIESQRALFDQRLAVQREIIETVMKDLENVRSLQQRGLQTSVRLVGAEQRAADERSGALELESAKIAATRAIGEAKRNRAQFLARQQDTSLRALQEARVKIEDLELRYARQAEQSGLLGGGSVNALLAADAVDFEFTLIRNRPPEADTNTALTLQTPLMPGDTLIVAVKAAQFNE